MFDTKKYLVNGPEPIEVATGMVTAWKTALENGGPVPFVRIGPEFAHLTPAQAEHRMFAIDSAIDLVDRWEAIPDVDVRRFSRNYFGDDDEARRSFADFTVAIRFAKDAQDSARPSTLH